MERASLARSRLVDTSRQFADKYIEVSAAVTHRHCPGGEHSHGGTAFTTWLNLSQAVQQAEAVAQAVGRKRPEVKNQIERNLTALKIDLLALDARIAKIVGSNRLPLMASHPVYQYLARRYGLNLRSVLWEPETVPTEEPWAEFKRILIEYPAKWLLWEGEPLKENVERLRAWRAECRLQSLC